MAEKALKWYHIRRVKLTPQYLGGVLAGIGVGVLLSQWAAYRGFYEVGIWRLAAFFLITVGGFLALRDQERQR